MQENNSAKSEKTQIRKKKKKKKNILPSTILRNNLNYRDLRELSIKKNVTVGDNRC
jgi:hypothetical protein